MFKRRHVMIKTTAAVECSKCQQRDW